MEEHAAALDVAEEARAAPAALVSALDQAGDVGKHELLLAQAHDAEVRGKRGEGVFGDLGPRARDRGEEGRFARVRQADEPGIRDQLEAQPDPALLARPARIGAARRLIGRALVVRVAEAALAPLAAARRTDPGPRDRQ